jgi:two-component system sensor histidine kinase/response regulator
MIRDNINNARVLLVEDNASSKKLEKMMLERLGCRADAVTSGNEAIEAIKREHYDLVLMDIMMYGMDGFETAREIRKLSQKDLKIIAITAYVFSGIREMCLEAGMDDCITKPIRLKDLEGALKNISRL